MVCGEGIREIDMKEFDNSNRFTKNRWLIISLWEHSDFSCGEMEIHWKQFDGCIFTEIFYRSQLIRGDYCSNDNKALTWLRLPDIPIQRWLYGLFEGNHLFAIVIVSSSAIKLQDTSSLEM